MTTTSKPGEPAPGPHQVRVLPTWVVSRRDVVRVRELQPTDGDAIRALHERCGPETLRQRYLHPAAHLGPILDWMLEWLPGAQGRTLVAEATVDGRRRIVGLAHLVPTANTDEAEVAFLVEDAWQGCGLGAGLLDLVTRLAQREGWASLHADVALDNERMSALFRTRGWSIAVRDGVHVHGLALRSDASG